MSVSRDYFEIEAELKKRIEGDNRFDKFSRLLYSIYQIEPMGVVVPRHKRDVQAVIEVASRLGVSVLSRGDAVPTSTILVTLLAAALIEGELFAGKIAPLPTVRLYGSRRRLSRPHAVRQDD